MTTRMSKGLNYMIYEHRLRDLGLFHLVKWGQGMTHEQPMTP